MGDWDSFGNQQQNFMDSKSNDFYPTFYDENYGGVQQNQIPSYNPNMYPSILTPSANYDNYEPNNMESEVEDELPLLDELEIYPERILEKSLIILNPYAKVDKASNPQYLFEQTDLAGPVAFCIALGVALFLSGNKVNFGYIYGLSISSVVILYVLLSLMSDRAQNYVTIAGVASILGYGILPIVGLSIFGIFFMLTTIPGQIITFLSILLSTASASRIFCLMTGNPDQRFLIAYPCALAYMAFSMLVLF